MCTKKRCLDLLEALPESKLVDVLEYLQGLIADNGWEKIPNQTTMAAIEEAETMGAAPERYKSYTDVKQLIKDLSD